MKAYILKKSGGPEVLKISEAPEPVCNHDEVKIKLLAIGINYAEVLSRKGKYSWAPKRPYILGMEGYGEVVKIGKDVKKVKVGEKVIAGAQYGMYAEYVSVKEHLVFKSIEGLTEKENAAVLVNFMTAWVALLKLARIHKEDKILIQAAAGGVGTAAIQLAKSIGCSVLGTASKPEKLELIKKLGADHAINYANEDFDEYIKENVGDVDVVLEVVGGDVFRKSVNALAPFGRVVVAGYASNPFSKYNPFSWYKTWKNAPRLGIMDMAINSMSLAATHIGYLTANRQVSESEWAALSGFIKDHNLKPVVNHVFSFDQLPEAQRLMESRQSSGKIVVTL